MVNGTTKISETVKQAETAGMEEFKATPYYQGLGIEELQGQLAEYQADDSALRTQAEAQYRPTYESGLESIRQELEKQVQGYGSQLEGLSAGYDRQRRNTNAAYDESATDLENALTKRGLGRSSLVSTQGAYLEKQRNQALADIDQDENAAISAINEKIALLTDQAAQSERTLAGNYARQLESRIGELKEQNKSAAVSLQLQIAALQQQGYEAYQNWLMESQEQEVREREQALKEREFEAEQAALQAEQAAKQTSGGSGSGTKKNTGTTAKATKSQSGQSAVSGALVSLAEALKNRIRSKASGGSSGTGGTAGSLSKWQASVK